MKSKITIVYILMLLLVLSGNSCFDDSGSDKQADNSQKYLPGEQFSSENVLAKKQFNASAYIKPWVISEAEKYMKQLGYEGIPLEEASLIAVSAVQSTVLNNAAIRVPQFQELKYTTYQSIGCDIDHTNIQKGDIVLVVSRNPQCMALISEHSFHHTLLCIADPQSNDDPVFVTAVGDSSSQVTCYPLNDTRTNGDRAVVLRVYNADDRLIDTAVNFAIGQIGKPFNMTGSKNCTDKYYCSQIVWRSFFEAGLNIDVNHYNFNDYGLVLPDDIYQSPYLYIVKTSN